MASTSSSSTVVTPGADRRRYDVFLSFRGEDTRHSFTDHLYEALVRAGLWTFRDNDGIERGEDLKPEIERAITESRSSIVVLSENYANSTWCLDELLLILEQMRNFSHFVFPVFYHVDPSDVRKHQKSFAIKVNTGVEGLQTPAEWKRDEDLLKADVTQLVNKTAMILSGKQQKCFGDALSMEVNAKVEGVQTSSKWMEHNVHQWNAALTEVANLSGMVVSGSETNFIAKIVDIIHSKLDRKLVGIPPHLTGMGTRAKYINSWLKNEQSSAEVLAVYGMGGSGKTTLAKYIYNSNSRQFESSSFLEDIGKSCKQPHRLLELQKQLLTDILGGKKTTISNNSEGTSKIEEALQMKRVLIVLDDIDEHDQLSALLGTKTFNTKSKIIITTRVLTTHEWFEPTSRRCHKYAVKLLNDDESSELLSWHAFGSKIPLKGFKELAKQIAQYCAGNPLALEVLGSSLFVSAEDSQKGKSIEPWISTRNLLKKDIHSGIHGILLRSYDSLPYRTYKELFLHIACFFIGEDKDYVVKILEPGYFASAGIKTLINRCLLTVTPRNKLMMHQLLQEMGRTIIREESPKDPAKRSRVWCDQESYALLKKGKGSKTMEGLALDMQMLKKEKTVESWDLKTDSLTKMDNLKLLQLKYVQLTGSFENFPEELIWMCWHGFHLRTIPSDLFMGNLVAIEMSYSKLEQFEPPRVLESLKILNLKDSHNLVRIRSISRFPNLETLILWNCSSLADVCETIRNLKCLSVLDMTGCEELWKVSLKMKYKTSDSGGTSSQQPLFSLPPSLKQLSLNNCNLECNNYFCVNFGCQSCLQYLNLGNNLFDCLPKNIDLNRPHVLDLTYCPRLKSLCLPRTLKELYIYYCVSLEKITFQSAPFRLREIGYGGCFSLSEIQGLFKLVPIAKLDETDLGHMKWLKAYQNHEVGLIGDEITEGRSRHIQMLYEFGIMSTFLPGIKDPNMRSEYTSRSSILSFSVPVCPSNHRIQGLNVSFIYRLSEEEEYLWVLFAKISNTTKDLTWMYNPMVFGKPGVGEDAVWLSYWEIGNILDIGDEVNVSIVVGNGLVISECGASFVYTDEVETEIWQDNAEWEEVLGGDLSSFQLSTGLYYLCRRDFFESKEADRTTPDWFKILVGDTINYTEIQGWSKFGRSPQLKASFTELENFRCIIHDSGLEEFHKQETGGMSKASAADTFVEFASSAHGERLKSVITSETSRSSTTKVVMKVNFDSPTRKTEVLKAIAKLDGVEMVELDAEKGTLTVVGDFVSLHMAFHMRKITNSSEIISIGPNKEPEIISIGPNKEPEKELGK